MGTHLRNKDTFNCINVSDCQFECCLLETFTLGHGRSNPFCFNHFWLTLFSTARDYCSLVVVVLYSYCKFCKWLPFIVVFGDLHVVHTVKFICPSSMWAVCFSYFLSSPPPWPFRVRSFKLASRTAQKVCLTLMSDN